MDECYCQDIKHWHINDGEGKESQQGWTNHMQNEMLLADSWRKIAIFIHSMSFISCANGLHLKSLVRCLINCTSRGKCAECDLLT